MDHRETRDHRAYLALRVLLELKGVKDHLALLENLERKEKL